MAMVVKRFDVYLVNLDPTLGSEIQKPAVFGHFA
jgi:mRNA-degrading endonuclease toxin of MazEF toxin-antitoxin module